MVGVWGRQRHALGSGVAWRAVLLLLLLAAGRVCSSTGSRPGGRYCCGGWGAAGSCIARPAHVRNCGYSRRGGLGVPVPGIACRLTQAACPLPASVSAAQRRLPAGLPPTPGKAPIRAPLWPLWPLQQVRAAAHLHRYRKASLCLPITCSCKRYSPLPPLQVRAAAPARHPGPLPRHHQAAGVQARPAHAAAAARGGAAGSRRGGRRRQRRQQRRQGLMMMPGGVGGCSCCCGAASGGAARRRLRNRPEQQQWRGRPAPEARADGDARWARKGCGWRVGFIDRGALACLLVCLAPFGPPRRPARPVHYRVQQLQLLRR